MFIRHIFTSAGLSMTAECRQFLSQVRPDHRFLYCSIRSEFPWVTFFRNRREKASATKISPVSSLLKSILLYIFQDAL
jgi:hypothetical protein